MVLSIAMAAFTLFAMGVYKAHVTTGRWSRSGVELATIGIASALIGYAVGALYSHRRHVPSLRLGSYSVAGCWCLTTIPA
jgi:hypothetical protein